MEILQRFPGEHNERKNKRLYKVKILPAICEDKDKRCHKVCNPNIDEDCLIKSSVRHQENFFPIYISIQYFAASCFYNFIKYFLDSVRTDVWKSRNDNVYAHDSNLYELKGDGISPQDWQTNKYVIFVRQTILIAVYIPSDEDLLYKKRSQEVIDKLRDEKNDLMNKNISLKKKLKECENFFKVTTNMWRMEKTNLHQEKVELMEENLSLKKHLTELETKYELLKVEYQETLHDLGELSVKKTTDLNRRKRASEEPLKNSTTYSFLSNKNSSFLCSKCYATIQGDCQHDDERHCRTQESTNKSPDLLIPTASTSSQLSNHSSEDSGKLFSGTLVKSNEASTKNDPVHEVRGNTAVATDNMNATSVDLSFPINEAEQREKESVSLLSYDASSVISAEMGNMYKLLLLTIADRLLLSDSVKLKEWVSERISIETNLRVMDIMFRLDQKGVIGAFDLDQLRAFFETILRFDLVYLIDQFSSGDYPCLRKLSFSNSPRSESQMSNSRQVRRSGHVNTNTIPKRAFYAHGNAKVASDGQAVASRKDNARNPSSSETPTSSRINETKTTSSSSEDTTTQNTRKKCSSTDSRSSEKQHIHEEKWLCSHYKRRCYVKFECCNKFWPCHRCHNNESNCGRKKLKSRDTKMVKCTQCGKEQQFGENNQFCVSCNVKFADFYCGLCKHLTGMDDYPYHCDKCGICRIHGDRSFHCDVCGVCLDVQLRGNHKCREGSAHDECFICMEDAFTGCQILPCSHKVHKNCATQMIQRGITRCPICRESFAHKLTKGSSAKKNARKRT